MAVLTKKLARVTLETGYIAVGMIGFLRKDTSTVANTVFAAAGALEVKKTLDEISGLRNKAASAF